MNPVLFVGGVHGAGKTTICRQIALAIPAAHVTAGGLIREMGSAAAANPTDKVVSDVDANQELLLQGLERYRARIGADPIVLDGHFTLLGPDETLTEIPVIVFQKIAPRAALLVQTEVSVIHARLLERDGRAPSVALLSRLIHHERTHSQAVCAKLGIPLLAVRGDQRVGEPLISQVQIALCGAK
jgi:adenylate kinase